MKRLRYWLHLHMLPKVEMRAGMVLAERFKCTGSYQSFPFNPAWHPEGSVFRVHFNGRWIEVQATDRTHEDWGWEAVSVKPLRWDLGIAPGVEVRSPR